MQWINYDGVLDTNVKLNIDFVLSAMVLLLFLLSVIRL